MYILRYCTDPLGKLNYTLLLFHLFSSLPASLLPWRKRSLPFTCQTAKPISRRGCCGSNNIVPQSWVVPSESDFQIVCTGLLHSLVWILEIEGGEINCWWCDVLPLWVTIYLSACAYVFLSSGVLALAWLGQNLFYIHTTGSREEDGTLVAPAGKKSYKHDEV